MKPHNFDVQQLIDYLQGTANTLDSAVNELFEGMQEIDLTEEDHDTINNQIFLCDTCGWWCEISEQCNENEIVDCGVTNHCIDCCQHDY